MEQIRLFRKTDADIGAVTFPQERLPVKQRHKAGISAPPRCRNPPKKAPESVEDRPIKTKGVIFGGIRRLRRNARRQNRAKPTPYPNAVCPSRPRKNASGFGYSNSVKEKKSTTSEKENHPLRKDENSRGPIGAIRVRGRLWRERKGEEFDGSRKGKLSALQGGKARASIAQMYICAARRGKSP